MKRPHKFQSLAILGLVIESLALSIHNPFFSILEPLSKAESFINMLYIPISIISISACLLLLYKKLSGLYLARYSLSAILLIDLIDLNTEIERDFQIEVSSPGLNRPFNSIRQYQKNLNRVLEITLTDNRVLEGRLNEILEDKIEILEIVKTKNKYKPPKSLDNI